MHIKGNNGQVVVTVTMLPCEQRHQEATGRAVLEACRRAHCRCFTNAALFLPSTHPEGRLQAPSFCRREPGAPEALAAPGHSMGSIPRQVEVTQHSTSRGCIPGTAVSAHSVHLHSQSFHSIALRGLHEAPDRELTARKGS